MYLVDRGGYWSSDPKAPALTQLHLGLSSYPVGQRGTAGRHVQLNSPVQDTHRSESQESVAVELKTEYGLLERSAGQLGKLAVGELDVALLEGRA